MKSYVACYWTLDFHKSNTNKLHRIILDGCADIIFDLRSPSLSKGAFVVGLMTKFEVINLSQNHSLLGIRFFQIPYGNFSNIPFPSLLDIVCFLKIYGGMLQFP
ncbi:DUF6597 domain-containing transcriptional factor [Radiobacillus kanasensis]|uniref:DUF6597 domain-containing transcriptional factor n=1 Tax=Radiobacillus kanasensis TaxID=2844358 RepID=UPI0038B43F12